MSQYNLDKIFVFPEPEEIDPMHKDLNGWTLKDWDHHGMAGWDGSTYFLQLDLYSRDKPNSIAWWIGSPSDPLNWRSPYEIRVVLSQILDLPPDYVLQFQPGMFQQLIDERNADQSDREAISRLEIVDARYAGKRPRSFGLTPEMLAVYLVEGVSATNRVRPA